MAKETKPPTGMKSAYELALERLAREGIAEPSPTALDEAARERIAEARRHGEARLAELEILHRDRLRKLPDPEARRQAEDDYARDRARVQEATEAKVQKIRGGG